MGKLIDGASRWQATARIRQLQKIQDKKLVLCELFIIMKTTSLKSFLRENMSFDPKQQNQAYTVANVKPNTCLDKDKLQNIKKVILDNGFTIKNILYRQLTKQQAINIYYKLEKKPFYQELLAYMLSGYCCIMLLCHQTENPIQKWRSIVGPTDPQEARKKQPKSLRAIYGTTLIKNELHAPQDHLQANKQRDQFKFPIPQKIPMWSYNPYKITLQSLLKFIYPPNLQHPEVNSRLDIFAQFGPVFNYHSVDQCLCKKCCVYGKQKLETVKKDKINEEKDRLGILDIENKTSKFVSKKKQSKVKISPIRILKYKSIFRTYGTIYVRIVNIIAMSLVICQAVDKCNTFQPTNS